MEVPNPYDSALPAACDDLPEGCRRFPERIPEAAPEDPNDVMGISLGAGAVMGLRVDMVGPIELRETYTRLTNPRKDPTDLRNVQGSLGLRLGF